MSLRIFIALLIFLVKSGMRQLAIIQLVLAVSSKSSCSSIAGLLHIKLYCSQNMG